MADVRIKDLTASADVDDYFAGDSTSGGTRKAIRKHAAAADPTTGDDLADGYVTGSIWYNTSSGSVFICRSPALGAADWIEIGSASVTFAAVKSALAAADSTIDVNGQSIDSVDALGATSVTASTVDAESDLVAAGTVEITGIGTPSQITSDQTDYAPAQMTGVAAVRISSDAARAIRSMGAQAAGAVRALVNVGSYTITLKHDYTSGTTAAMRFALSGAADVDIPAGAAVLCWYDTTSSRWRVVGGAGGAALTAAAIITAMASAASDLDLNTHKLTGVQAGTAASHAVNKTQLDGVAFPAPVTDSSNARTLGDSDNGKLILCTRNGGITVTIPDSLTVGFSCQFAVSGTGAGIVFAVSGTQVLKKPAAYDSKCSASEATCGVICFSSTRAQLTGNLDAAGTGFAVS
jgi:hypothetical protein